MPGGNSVTAAAIWTEGDRVYARCGSNTWDPESGQVIIDFGRDRVSDNVSLIDDFRTEEVN